MPLEVTRVRWTELASTAPSLPGGAESQVETLLSILRSVDDDDYSPFVAEGAVDRIQKQIGPLGLTLRTSNGLELSDLGRSWLLDPNGSDLFRLLHARIAYFGEALARAAQSPTRAEDLLEDARRGSIGDRRAAAGRTRRIASRSRTPAPRANTPSKLKQGPMTGVALPDKRSCWCSHTDRSRKHGTGRGMARERECTEPRSSPPLKTVGVRRGSYRARGRATDGWRDSPPPLRRRQLGPQAEPHRGRTTSTRRRWGGRLNRLRAVRHHGYGAGTRRRVADGGP
jgi:hypothetical protein